MLETVSGRQVFRNLIQNGKSAKARSGKIQMVYLNGEELKVAFSLYRTMGSAVKRNKLKRQMKSALLEIDREGTIVPGTYLFKARRDSLTLSYQELKDDLKELLKGSGRT